jgi:hypothetical protein
LKCGCPNTQIDSIVLYPETVALSLKALKVEAETGFITNPNLHSFSIVLQDSCEDADNDAYSTGIWYQEHSFKQDYPILFINTPPGCCEL